jgi:hypothetical protein
MADTEEGFGKKRKRANMKEEQRRRRREMKELMRKKQRMDQEGKSWKTMRNPQKKGRTESELMEEEKDWTR